MGSTRPRLDSASLPPPGNESIIHLRARLPSITSIHAQSDPTGLINPTNQSINIPDRHTKHLLLPTSRGHPATGPAIGAEISDACYWDYYWYTPYLPTYLPTTYLPIPFSFLLSS